MSMSRREFDLNNVTMKMKLHLNGGKEFNKSCYDVMYGKKKIGECVRGREGNESVNKLFVNDREFNLTNMPRVMVEDILREAVSAA